MRPAESEIRAKTPAYRRLRAVRVSTSHVPKPSLLDKIRLIEGFFIITPSQCGAIFERLGKDNPDQKYCEQVLLNDGDQVLKWLIAIHQWCCEQKINIVVFDSYDSELRGLPTFDW